MEDHDNTNHNHHENQVINNNYNNNGGGAAGGTPAAGSSRWTPTKEQVNMLEGLYRQGIRTPSAEQIQQITSRLRAFGHIEGKNVFYWFQNHKARQRQKQKQDTVAAYINLNRFLHDTNCRTTTTTTTTTHQQYPNCPNANVVCGQYYVPIQTQIADPVGTFHQQIFHQNKNIPMKTSTTSTSRRPPRLEKFTHKSSLLPTAASAGYNHVPQPVYTVDHHASSASETVNDEAVMIGNNYQETLALFPLSPTGVLEGKLDREDRRISENIPISTSASRCYTDLSATSSGFEEGCSSPGDADSTFYDFFSR